MVRHHPRRALTFGWERARHVFDEPNIHDLLKAHWREVGCDHAGCPLDPDFDRFVELDDQGLYRIWAARDGATFVGYAGWFVQPHLHFRRTLHATCDLVMLSPEYRGYGIEMLRQAFQALRALGVQRCIMESTDALPLSPVLTRLGFAHRGDIWIKVL